MRTAILLLPLLALASPVFAQDHQAHQHAPEEQAEEETDRATDADDHSTMDHSSMQHGAVDQSHMDHGKMDHGGMDHSSMKSPGPADDTPIPEGPPPPEAFEGPTYAADEAVGIERMNSSRLQVMRQVRGMPVAWIQADRLEYRMHEGKDGYLWDVQGFYGGDYDKLWFKSEGEGAIGEKPESAELQALWSHAIGPWFDLQTGVRQNLTGPERTHAVVGVQGLAPYLFEIDAAAFLSTKGDLTARVEAELDQRITQRLILQPRAEIALSAQDIPELGIGSGVDRIEAGLRLRYEIAREFAPYIGVAQEWRLGDSADYARANGEDPSQLSFVVGLRAWF